MRIILGFEYRVSIGNESQISIKHEGEILVGLEGQVSTKCDVRHPSNNNTIEKHF